MNRTGTARFDISYCETSAGGVRELVEQFDGYFEQSSENMIQNHTPDGRFADQPRSDERYVPKDVWRQVMNPPSREATTRLSADPDADPRYADESKPVPRQLLEKLVALTKPPPQDLLDTERQQVEAFATYWLGWFQRQYERTAATDRLYPLNRKECLATRFPLEQEHKDR